MLGNWDGGATLSEKMRKLVFVSAAPRNSSANEYVPGNIISERPLCAAGPWHRYPEERPEKDGYCLVLDFGSTPSVLWWDLGYGWRTESDKPTHWASVQPPTVKEYLTVRGEKGSHD